MDEPLFAPRRRSYNLPLLHRDETTTDAGLGDLRLVDGDDGRGDTDGKTRDDTANDEHAAILVGREVSVRSMGVRRRVGNDVDGANRFARCRRFGHSPPGSAAQGRLDGLHLGVADKKVLRTREARMRGQVVPECRVVNE